jgi:hypothetical protein
MGIRNLDFKAGTKILAELIDRFQRFPAQR